MASDLAAELSPSTYDDIKPSSEVSTNEVDSPTKGDIPSSIPNGHPKGDLKWAVVSGENSVLQDVHFPVTEDTVPRANGSSMVNQTPILSNETVDSSTNPVFTPFVNPHPSTSLPTSAPLSPDQEAKYALLLTAVQNWTTVPSSKKSQEGSPITPSDKMWLTRDCLLRYLRASKWVAPTATTRLLATLTWRREYGVVNLTDDYISEENETGKQVILGYDNQGRPCLYLNPHKQNTKGRDKQIQHVMFMIERCIDLMAPGVENHALIVNFMESRKGQNATVGQAREMLHIIQNHYPERLGRALVQGVPWIVWGFFKAISPFIDPVTREKLKFDEDLRKLVPPEQLIKAFGGEVEFEYNHEKYWPALNLLARQRKKEQEERWEKAGGVIGESENYLRGFGQSVTTTEGAKTA